MTLPRYGTDGWRGGDSLTLYAFVDRVTGVVTVRPGGANGIGPEADVRVATRAEAERLWQCPLARGWVVVD